MTTYYVRSAGGNNGNTGLSFAQGWATIQFAVDFVTLAAGDLILICADGTHAPTTRIDIDTTSGTQAAPIILRGASATGVDDGTVATISGSGITTDDTVRFGASTGFYQFHNLRVTAATADAFSDNNITTAGDNLWLNCEIDNATGNGAETGSHRWAFINCDIHNNTIGVAGWSATTNRLNDLRVVNCSIHDNSSHGIEIHGTSNAIIGNIIYDNGGDGINIYRNSNNHLIMNNTIYGNTGDGYGVQSSLASGGNSVFLNNSLDTNGAYGVSDYASHTNGHVDYNHFNGNVTAARQNFATGANDITGDPDFVSVTDGSEDFDTGASSVLQGAGTQSAEI